MKSRSRTLFEKSLAAMLSAIEVYNKPDFAYREETFSVLAVNAWELLLKARILQLEKNRISSILAYERRHLANGSTSTKLYRKVNRSGNPLSIGLFKALDSLVNKHSDDIGPLVRSNLELLVEIRDNSIHYMNRDYELNRRILEVGTASVRNYAALCRRWFHADLSDYSLFIMPLAFVRDVHTAEATPLNVDEQRLLQFIQETEAKAEEENEHGDYSVALAVDLVLKRTSGESVAEVRITRDPTATPIRLDEEDIRQRYPWDYQALTGHLKGRYADFVQNGDYHRLRKSLQPDPAFCCVRLLDPKKPKGIRKCFFNPNIVQEFDKHYTLASGSP